MNRSNNLLYKARSSKEVHFPQSRGYVRNGVILPVLLRIIKNDTLAN